MLKVEGVITANKSQQQPAARPHLGITPDIKLKMRAVWGKDSESWDDSVMYMFSWVLMRSGEITAIRISL